VKLVGGGKRFDSVTPFYSKLKITKLSDLYKIEVAEFVHNYIYNNLPPSLSRYFFKHVNTPFEQRDFPLMKTTSIFLVIKQAGCNVVSNIKVSLFGIQSSKKYKTNNEIFQKEVKTLLY